MKIKQKALGVLILGLPFMGAAQIQGDINHYSFTGSFNHNPNTCSSDMTAQHMVDISNSFVGDSVKFIDYGGGVMHAEMNSTGVSPWTVQLPIPNWYTESDEYVSGGLLNVPMPPFINKIISGNDTLYNVNPHFVSEPVSNPCTYSSVDGKVYVDNDNNCSFNTGDSAIFLLQVKPSVVFSSAPAFGPQNGYTNATGDYNLTIQDSWMTSYTVSIPTMYQFIFPNSTCTPSSYSFTTLPQTGVDFVLECADVDTYVSGTSGGNVHAALPFNFHPSVANIGCDQVSGVLKMVLDPNVSYNAANSSNPADYVIGDTLFWNYTNLNNIAGGAYWNSIVGSIELMPAPSVVTGDVLCFDIITGVPANDVNPLNNSKTVCVNVVAAYDPNIKLVEPAGIGIEGFIPASTTKLTYTIHFQNTGSADAINIKVIDSLEQNVIPSTFRVLSSSHTMAPVWLDSDVIRFDFNNIYLPDSNANEPDSHGFVEFEIGMVQGLTEGTEIKNKAHIYFDNNPAVVTDNALNTIEYTFGFEDIEHNEFVVYPNPTTGMCYLHNVSNFKSVEVMNINGKVLFIENSTSIDLGELPSGIYFARILTGDDQQVKKIVKN
jgi:uncharacterized repeat protein (TIGR01451 family)